MHPGVTSSASVSMVNQPRHVRVAQVVEYVGCRARADGLSDGEIAALCQKTVRLYGTGKAQARHLQTATVRAC